MATVLVRRGLRRPRGGESVPRGGAPGPRPPCCSATSRVAVERIRVGGRRTERICVHGDYDVDGICATAVAVLVAARARRDGRVAAAEPLRGGLRRRRRDDRAARGGRRRPRTHRRLRHHGGRRGRAGARARARRDRHRSPPTRRGRCRTARSSPPARPTIRSRSSAAPASCYKLARALLGDDHPALARVLDLVALATIADVVPLVDENRALAAAGLRAMARTQPSRPAGADADGAGRSGCGRRGRSRRSGSRRGSTRPAASDDPTSRSSSS